MNPELFNRHVEASRARLEEVEAKLADPSVVSDRRAMSELGREHRRLRRVLAAAEQYSALAGRLAQARELAGEGDPEMAELAAAEAAEVEPLLARAEAELRLALLPAEESDERDAIVEIRAGTGGEEAALFAGDLLRMYQRFAERRGWKSELLSSSPSELGGFKEVVLALRGEEAYGLLKYEGGVHRVQRVPETESQGRIHTSAATVAVLPEAEEVDVEIGPEELRIDTFRASGAGGQHVNKTDSAIRITHLPTGLVVSCQDEKSQHKNKVKALRVLRARLYERALAEQQAERSANRRLIVGTGDRSAKIRTYNFPQNRVTDHRINLTTHRLAEVLDGDLEELLDALRLHDAEQRLREGVP